MKIRQFGFLFRLFVVGVFVTGGFMTLGTEAQAHGLGFHVAAAQGESGHFQIGGSWDTAVAENRLINYRMNLGLETFKLKNYWGETEKLSGWILENTLGFRLFADDKVRIWAGPQIITGFYKEDLGIGLGLSLGANFHLDKKRSLGMTIGARRSEYSGIWDYSEYESVGYLRLDYFFRSKNDYFTKN